MSGWRRKLAPKDAAASPRTPLEGVPPQSPTNIPWMPSARNTVPKIDAERERNLGTDEIRGLDVYLHIERLTPQVKCKADRRLSDLALRL